MKLSLSFTFLLVGAMVVLLYVRAEQTPEEVCNSLNLGNAVEAPDVHSIYINFINDSANDREKLTEVGESYEEFLEQMAGAINNEQRTASIVNDYRVIACKLTGKLAPRGEE